MPSPDTFPSKSTSPTELPDIIKQFTKAAIRTQPWDVLATCICCCYIGYFSALSKGDILPTKERLERPVATQKTDTGLTPGLLKVLNKQILSNPQNDTRPPLSYLVL
ncbi:ropporin-1-like protein [Salvelinus sp. IW2-2015]|uniref:ropporin-1-like protein n=1 Tax=Salvelinus sp. IW2-2015 TaxID=2691554 RepID=UPI000CEA7CD6|nr:ropporin-1-like protein [Salvelinus alpinus]